jgi:hypothetical protein
LTVIARQASGIPAGVDPTYHRIKTLAAVNASFSCQPTGGKNGEIRVISYLPHFQVTKDAILSASQQHEVTCGCNGHDTFTLIGPPDNVARAIELAKSL